MAEPYEQAATSESADADSNAVKKTSIDLGLAWLYSPDKLLDEACAWVWQDFSNSVYSSVVMAAFLGLVLNSYATTAAWEESGRVKPPYCSDLASAYSEACMECRVGEGTMVCTGSGTGDENCEVLKTPSIGGVNATSFSFFIIGMSCLSQLVAFIFLGRSGDYGDNRKTYLLWSSMVGATALIMFAFFPVGEAYPKHIFAALLTIVSNTAFGLAQIYYNAYLPLLTEDMAEREKGRVAAADIENQLSSYGLAAGYYGGVLGLVVSIAILVASGGTAEGASEYAAASSFRWCIVMSGIWWFVGNLLTIPRLQDRPGKGGSPPWYHSAAKFYGTIRWTYTNLPVTFRYLVLYFLYSDGFATIAGVGVLYARLEMCASTSDLFVIAIEAPLCAAMGNFLFLRISRYFQLSNRQMVVLVLCLIAVLPAWGLLGYATSSLGFRNLWEAYLLGAYFGFSLGAIQNFTRTMFCELIPKSRESEFFSFYELTDKGSSWLGPVVVAALAAGEGGTLRLAFVYILCMTIIPAYFIYQLDMERGIADAQRVDEEDQASEEQEHLQNDEIKLAEGGDVELPPTAKTEGEGEV